MSTATPAARDNRGVPALLDLDAIFAGRFAPSRAAVREHLVNVRAKVVGDPDRLALLWALRADPLAGYFATRFLCRVGGFPFLPQWLDEPTRTRLEVLALLGRALRCFGRQRSGGWRVSSAPLPTPSAPSPDVADLLEMGAAR